MATSPISAADFQSKFDRNFVFGVGMDTVRDSDIDGAMDDALLVYNPNLFDTASGKIAFLYLTAHFVATNIQAAGGLSASPSDRGVGNRSTGVVLGKSVGQVSVNYADMPERVKHIAMLQPLWETDYGKKYVTMLLPKLCGNVSAIEGPLGEDVVIPAVPDAGP